MKIFYKLEEGVFKGFYHFKEPPDKTYIEIEKEEFKSILNKQGEVYFSKKNMHLKVAIIPEGCEMIKPVMNYEREEIIESASLEERCDYWKERMLIITKELNLLKDSGLDGDLDYLILEKKMEKYTKNYLDANHELALKINETI